MLFLGVIGRCSHWFTKALAQASLNMLIDLAVCLDHLLRNHNRYCLPSLPPSPSKPMQIRHAPHSPSEKRSKETIMEPHTASPFTVFMDQKNLEYLRTTKCLNDHQARWALFFTWFHFTLSYQPGPRNTKSNSLSRVYTAQNPNSDSEPILPPS